MSHNMSVWTMIGLDVFMIVYTLWVISSSRSLGKRGPIIAGSMLAWLGALHMGLSTQSLFPQTISGVAFLLVIFAAVGAVGFVLLAIPAARAVLWNLEQRQLLLLQGVRVFFGATFLMQASTGVLPPAFGILDGYTHIGAGFLGMAAAYSIATAAQGERRAWFANIFGLLDILIVASTLALVLLPELGPHHPMMYAVFFPAPLWLWFHVISIAKLLRGECSRMQPLAA
jgi:hypothetical protein